MAPSLQLDEGDDEPWLQDLHQILMESQDGHAAIPSLDPGSRLGRPTSRTETPAPGPSSEPPQAAVLRRARRRRASTTEDARAWSEEVDIEPAEGADVEIVQPHEQITRSVDVQQHHAALLAVATASTMLDTSRARSTQTDAPPAIPHPAATPAPRATPRPLASPPPPVPGADSHTRRRRLHTTGDHAVEAAPSPAVQRVAAADLAAAHARPAALPWNTPIADIDALPAADTLATPHRPAPVLMQATEDPALLDTMMAPALDRSSDPAAHDSEPLPPIATPASGPRFTQAPLEVQRKRWWVPTNELPSRDSLVALIVGGAVIIVTAFFALHVLLR
jgi:hypothetical protein